METKPQTNQTEKKWYPIRRCWVKIECALNNHLIHLSIACMCFGSVDSMSKCNIVMIWTPDCLKKNKLKREPLQLLKEFEALPRLTLPETNIATITPDLPKGKLVFQPFIFGGYSLGRIRFVIPSDFSVKFHQSPGFLTGILHTR